MSYAYPISVLSIIIGESDFFLTQKRLNKKKKRDTLSYLSIEYSKSLSNNLGFAMVIYNQSGSKTQEHSNSHVEDLLHEIIMRLDRIEHRIDNAMYPDESFLHKDFIFHVNEQKKLLDSGEACVYSSMDEFLESLE